MIERIPNWPYPHGDQDPWDMEVYRALTEESVARIQDFDILKINNVPWVDVREYGAKFDGSTDDTTAIQAAIDSIDAGMVLMPSGTTVISAALVMDSNITLRGMSRNATIIKCSNFADYAIKASSENRMSFRDFRIDGDSQADNLGGIYLDTCYQVDLMCIDVLGFENHRPDG